ncbi:hypothetical protein GZH47_25650 [Paenibacillus rhizovicinus]|uniref:Uncharacterized protein n=1 Tax=Paenibacillus rhizovicinus TaxID=2704463 RepID=A0A6C0P696_9BACL|nr:hypothetical protein [Paenibacillus rhizovicinus]QHW33846.1 hypothetical protein GZH47_25650 [Paenibacillus rhizovicinus]
MKRRTWGMTYTALLCRLILDESKLEAHERRSGSAGLQGEEEEAVASWTELDGNAMKTGTR